MTDATRAVSASSPAAAYSAGLFRGQALGQSIATSDALAEQFRAGYDLGWSSGYDVGYGAAVHEVFDRAEWLAGEQVGQGPSHLELLRRRCEHHPAGCPCLDCERYAARLAGRSVAA